MFSSPTHTPPPDSDSEEDDLDLPMVDIGTPKKPKPEPSSEQNQPTNHSSQQQCRNMGWLTASSSAASRAPSSSEPATRPPSHRTQFKEAQEALRFMSENIKHLSPVRSAHQATTSSGSNKTAIRVRKLSKSLQAKTDMKRKLDELKSRNGIQGIARSEEAKSREASMITDIGSLVDVHSLTHKQALLQEPRPSMNRVVTDLLPASLPTNHGKSVFMHQPSLITELYPPGVDTEDGGLLGNALSQGSPEDLRTIVCSQMLPLAYTAKPVPIELTQWLFQLMACSEDPQVSSGAKRSLSELLQQAAVLRHKNSSFSTPTVAEITDVLVSLGAERKKLCPQMTGGGTEVHTVPLDRDVLPSPPPSTNLFNLVSYISQCVQTVADYSVPQLEEMILILSSLSLDRCCQHYLRRSLQVCIHLLLAAYPERVWQKAVTRLSPQLASLSSHHQDKVSLARLLTGTRSREKVLLRDFCRLCLVRMSDLPTDADMDETTSENGQDDIKIVDDSSAGHEAKLPPQDGGEPLDKKMRLVENGAEASSFSDCVFMKLVLKSYHRGMPEKMSDRDYHHLHSLLHLLQLYSPISDLSFPGPASRQEFVRLLGVLRGAVREDPMRPVTSVVKDTLIHMKLELESQKSHGARDRQSDLFSFVS